MDLRTVANRLFHRYKVSDTIVTTINAQSEFILMGETGSQSRHPTAEQGSL